MKIFHPELFQGSSKKKNYFEGWYYKISTGDETFAVIPGISLGEDSHAFIQFIDGKTHKTYYNRFPLEDFDSNSDNFEVNIGQNHFTLEGISLDIDKEELVLKGEFRFYNITTYPASFFSPGIMGPFSFIPAMECYHGVVSADHLVEGNMIRNGEQINVNKGRGYIEKDWGRSMPSSWIWIHSNFFDNPGISFMMSIARIPWIGSSFTGHLCFLLIKGNFYSFTTYNRSRYSIEQSNDNHIIIRLKNKKYTVEIQFRNPDLGGDLKAPVNGGMERIIRENTDSEIFLSLSERGGKCLFQGYGKSCGIEVTGKIDELI
ncbi:MAG: tocopherol cyclase family protein [Spirochaetales bacterium]|uniref:Tocopherol cyclase family protein n=1 Tax=Candidatus Thalassospirochaeta sargassi TaxID=3119039 RepID=A0AAJ1MKG7_9SPIO|nr:tocopherol cyclase family protein [Spirochaetales bacterium]